MECLRTLNCVDSATVYTTDTISKVVFEVDLDMLLNFNMFKLLRRLEQ